MTQRTITGMLVVVVLLTAGWAAQRAVPPAASEDGIAVYFSPLGGCTDAIIQEIDGARMSIHVQAYSFTSARLAKALVDASKRDLIVRVLLDSSQRTAQYSSYTFFRNQNIAVFIDSKHAIAHNKVMVIDGRTVITGSFNFTKAAEERNAENLLIIKGKTGLARAYMGNIERHLAHSVVTRQVSEARAVAVTESATFPLPK